MNPNIQALKQNIERAQEFHERASFFTRTRLDLKHGRLSLLSLQRNMNQSLISAYIWELALPYIPEESKPRVRMMRDSDLADACKDYRDFVEATGVDAPKTCYETHTPPHPAK